MKQSDVDRFHSKYDRRSDDECWEWTASTYGNGYGLFNTSRQSYDRETLLAHRVSLSLHLGRRIRRGMLVLHSCDNRLCVNPMHLSEGTCSENASQAFERGGHKPPTKHGSDNHATSLTEQEVVEIYGLSHSKTKRQKEIAEMYSVSQSAVSAIKRRKTWRHIHHER